MVKKLEKSNCPGIALAAIKEASENAKGQIVVKRFIYGKLLDWHKEAEGPEVPVEFTYKGKEVVSS